VTLGRHVVLAFWGHALLVGALVAALALGVDLAFEKPDVVLGPEHFARALRRLGDALPPLCAFLGAWITLGRLHREGSLVAVAAHGIPMRRIGAWLVLGALPLAAAAQALDALPPAGGTRAPSSPDAEQRPGRPLAGRGSFFRTGAPHGRRERGAAFLPGERRLLFGDAPLPPPTSPRDQVRLRVDEEWRLEDGGLVVVHPESRELWVGTTLRAPRSLVWGRRAAVPGLAALRRWAAAEPGRADLRFALESRLRGGARVLAILLVGLAFWLRPSAEPFLRRSVPAFLLAGAYVALEAWAGALGVVGAASPTLCAFGPVAAFGALGLAGWCACDRAT